MPICNKEDDNAARLGKVLVGIEILPKPEQQGGAAGPVRHVGRGAVNGETKSDHKQRRATLQLRPHSAVQSRGRRREPAAQCAAHTKSSVLHTAQHTKPPLVGSCTLHTHTKPCTVDRKA